MDPGEWRLRSEAEPVSYCDPQTQRWTSGTFDFAVKSEHPAARSPGVQPQATAGQPGSLGGLRQGQTTSQLQSDVRPDEQAELRRQESGAPPQSMPALYQAPPPSAAFAAAAPAWMRRPWPLGRRGSKRPNACCLDGTTAVRQRRRRYNGG